MEYININVVVNSIKGNTGIADFSKLKELGYLSVNTVLFGKTIAEVATIKSGDKYEYMEIEDDSKFKCIIRNVSFNDFIEDIVLYETDKNYSKEESQSYLKTAHNLELVRKENSEYLLSDFSKGREEIGFINEIALKVMKLKEIFKISKLEKIHFEFIKNDYKDDYYHFCEKIEIDQNDFNIQHDVLDDFEGGFDSTKCEMPDIIGTNIEKLPKARSLIMEISKRNILSPKTKW